MFLNKFDQYRPEVCSEIKENLILKDPYKDSQKYKKTLKNYDHEI